MPLPWKEKGEISLSVPLLRAEGGEEAAQVGLEATEDGCAPIIEAAILPLSPDKSFVVDVARGLLMVSRGLVFNCGCLEGSATCLLQLKENHAFAWRGGLVGEWGLRRNK